MVKALGLGLQGGMLRIRLNFRAYGSMLIVL